METKAFNIIFFLITPWKYSDWKVACLLSFIYISVNFLTTSIASFLIFCQSPWKFLNFHWVLEITGIMKYYKSFPGLSRSKEVWLALFRFLKVRYISSWSVKVFRHFFGCQIILDCYLQWKITSFIIHCLIE